MVPAVLRDGDGASTTTLLHILRRLASHVSRPRSAVVAEPMTYMPIAVAVGYLREPDSELPPARTRLRPPDPHPTGRSRRTARPPHRPPRPPPGPPRPTARDRPGRAANPPPGRRGRNTLQPTRPREHSSRRRVGCTDLVERSGPGLADDRLRRMRGPYANSRSSRKTAPASSPTGRAEASERSPCSRMDQGLGPADQHVPAVGGGRAARPVRPQQLLQAGAVMLHKRLQAVDVPLAFLGAHRAQRDAQRLPVRPVPLTRRGQGPKEPPRRQDVRRVQRHGRCDSSGTGEYDC